MAPPRGRYYNYQGEPATHTTYRERTGKFRWLLSFAWKDASGAHHVEHVDLERYASKAIGSQMDAEIVATRWMGQEAWKRVPCYHCKAEPFRMCVKPNGVERLPHGCRMIKVGAG